MGKAPPSRLEQVGLLAERVARTRAREIRAITVNAPPLLVIFQSRPSRERKQAPHSVSAVSIGPLAKTPYLPSSTGAADYTIESGAATAAPAPTEIQEMAAAASSHSAAQAAPAGRSDCGSLC